MIILSKNQMYYNNDFSYYEILLVETLGIYNHPFFFGSLTGQLFL